jgi:guanine deaminase
VYDDFGLMRERAVYAHSIWLDDEDRALMRDTRSAAAISPTSNLFLASGYFDYQKADAADFRYGLASDVGGGMSFSPFRTMQAAYVVGREGHAKQGQSLSPGACGGSTRRAPRRRWAWAGDRQSAAGLRGRLCVINPAARRCWRARRPRPRPGRAAVCHDRAGR